MSRNALLTLAIIIGSQAACGALQESSGGAAQVPAPRPVERASEDDCAIIVEIGKRELHWDFANPPHAAFLPSFDAPDGGTYLEDCPWQKLGVASPLISVRGSAMGFFITRPVYSGTVAKVWFQYNVAAIRGTNGRTIPPFVERELCTVEKTAGRWRLTGCELTTLR